MKIGFTGTRKGMNEFQMDAVRDFLEFHYLEITEVHHGDCVGADEQFHRLAETMGIRVVLHPPILTRNRAFCSADETLDPKPYLERNHDIVDATDYLIAVPKEVEEILRSGTWATYRYAKRHKKPTMLVTPKRVDADGT